jgi:hypothetical protein
VELRRRDYRTLLAEMSRRRAEADHLAPAIGHFLKVTKSYWPGLFHCYAVPDLPRTNNDLEHFFGSARYQERRTTGRKFAAPSTVVRGAVRLVAAVATRLKLFSAAELRPMGIPAWQQLRRDLAERHEARRAQHRFRRAPEAYLAQAETILLKSALPPSFFSRAGIRSAVQAAIAVSLRWVARRSGFWTVQGSARSSRLTWAGW